MRSQSTMSERSMTNGKERTLTDLGRDGDPEAEF